MSWRAVGTILLVLSLACGQTPSETPEGPAPAPPPPPPPEQAQGLSLGLAADGPVPGVLFLDVSGPSDLEVRNETEETFSLVLVDSESGLEIPYEGDVPPGEVITWTLDADYGDYSLEARRAPGAEPMTVRVHVPWAFIPLNGASTSCGTKIPA